MTASDDGRLEVLVALARLEGKVDAALAQQGAKIDEHGRRLDAAEKAHSETDGRLRAVEATPVVTPAKMWTAIGTVATVAAAIVAALSPLLDRLYS